MLKKGMRLFLVAILSATVLSPVMGTVSVDASEVVAETDNQTRESDNYVWYYKVINGKTYRRLYNAYTKTWVTVWILCE